MAEGRMLKRVISESKKLGKLKSDSARLLYTWLIPWLDVEGRHSADIEIIKGHIFPKVKSMSLRKISSLIDILNNARLIILYSINGENYLQFTKFNELQSIRKDSIQEDSPIREVNIIKEKLNKPKPSYPRIKILECDIELTNLLLDKILENNPESRARKMTNKQKEGWQNDCRLMREQDGRAVSEIREVIIWAQDDDFWHTNILSMGKLRKQWDQLILKMGKTAKKKESWAERSERKEREREGKREDDKRN